MELPSTFRAFLNSFAKIVKAAAGAELQRRVNSTGRARSRLRLFKELQEKFSTFQEKFSTFSAPKSACLDQPGSYKVRL